MENKLQVTQERVLASLAEKVLYIEQLEFNLMQVVEKYNKLNEEHEMLKKEVEALRPAKNES